jgi:threonine dehydrogenase-like Zn-dependent dehydrogenase
MLAARAYKDETKFRLEEIDKPTPGSGDVVIEVKSAGLAYGVVIQWQRGFYPILPRTLGNEAAGIVAAVGDEVTEFAVGDRVRLHPNLCCRECEYCLTGREQMCDSHSIIGQGIFGPTAMPMHQQYLDGGLAQYVKAPAWLIDRLPDSVSFDAGAKVHDVADALLAWKKTGCEAGATVVFTAATGTVGSAFVRLAPLLGVGRVIAVGRSSERLAGLKALQPDLVDIVAFDELPEDWGEIGGLTQRIQEVAPEGVDAVIDFLPEGPGTWQAIASLKRGGTAVVMGANLAMPSFPTTLFMVNCWSIVGTRNCTREESHQVLRWLAEGRLHIDDLITHRFPLTEIDAAARMVLERPEPTWMVVVHP